MTTSHTSRRTFLGLAAGSALGAIGLSACGTSGPAQPGGAAASGSAAGGAAGSASMWSLTGQRTKVFGRTRWTRSTSSAKERSRSPSSRTTPTKPRSVPQWEPARPRR
jgi:hypothetical protein